MKAVVFHGINNVTLDNVPEPEIKNQTDVIIKITTAAICASDIHVKHEKSPFPPGRVLGHEYCGVVVRTGDQARNLKAGDRVAGHPIANCGYCFYCRRGQHSLCANAGIHGGPHHTENIQAHAEYARIPFADNTLVKIPEGVPDEDVIFTGDILSTGLTGLLRTNVRIGDRIVIFGAGPVGLCAIACAPLFGPQMVIAVDTLSNRLDIARKYGAITINATEKDPVAGIMDLTDGVGVDAGIEAAGAVATLKACMKAIRHGGQFSVLGTVPPGFLFDLSDRFFDIFSLSIGLGDQNYTEELIMLIKNGKLDLKPLITHTFPLTKAMEAYDVMEKRRDGCIKVILKPE
jgi:alcohol dehydrogenase